MATIPFTTASTEQSFTGLTPGPHVITVRMVDANGTAIPDSQTQVCGFLSFLQRKMAAHRDPVAAPTPALRPQLPLLRRRKTTHLNLKTG